MMEFYEFSVPGLKNVRHSYISAWQKIWKCWQEIYHACFENCDLPIENWIIYFIHRQNNLKNPEFLLCLIYHNIKKIWLFLDNVFRCKGKNKKPILLLNILSYNHDLLLEWSIVIISIVSTQSNILG